MSGITKFFHIASGDDGSPAVGLLHPDTLTKTAGSCHPLIKQAAAELPQRNDGIWVLLNAVSAGEFWSCNSNGDYFPEESLKYACDMSIPGVREKDYGFRTFMKYAYPYRHHINKDPAKSIGERVKLAVWNDQMKRVEIIHFLRKNSEFDEFGDLTKVGAPDLVEKVENGDEVPVSMGCKVPYDICSVCNNKAKSVSLYCDHLKYAMGQVMPDGRQVYAVNTYPKFFDISYVLKGAEKTAKVLKKLAGHKDCGRHSNKVVFWVSEGLEKAASENRDYVLPSAFQAEIIKIAQKTKKAEENKISTIRKEVPAEVGSKSDLGKVIPSMIDATEPTLKSAVLKAISRHSLPDICSTMASMGMDLKPHEMKRIIVLKIRGGAKSGDLGEPTVSSEHVQPSLIQLLKGQMQKRSSLREPLRNRVQNLLNADPQDIMDKIAANDEIVQTMTEEDLATSTLDKAAPLAALAAAAIYMMYRKNLRKAPIPKIILDAFKKYPELPAAVIGAGIGGAFGIAGQGMIRNFGQQEKLASVKAKALLYGGAGAVPYLSSGYVQAKWRRGEPISKTEAAVARHPGLIAGTGIGLLLGRKKIKKGLMSLFKKKAGADIPISDILLYSDDQELVDHAIAAGLCKVASRMANLLEQSTIGGK